MRAIQAKAEVLEARDEATRQLWQSYLHQARATRQTGLTGQRFESLTVVSNAAKIKPSLELRNEAIAAFALPDLRRILAFEQPQPPDTFPAFNADGSRYALGYPNGDVRVIQIGERAQTIHLGPQPGRAFPVQFTPDGRHLAVSHRTGRTATLALWDLNATDTPRITEPQTIERAVEFSPNGKHLMIALAGQRLATFDLRTSVRLHEFPVEFDAERILYRPDGKALAIYSFAHTNAVVYTLPEGKETARLPHPGRVYSLAWSQDGKRIATSANDFVVYLWDVESGTRLQELRGHKGEIVRMDFHPDGRFLFTGSWDGTSRIWDSRNGQQMLQAAGGFDKWLKGANRLQFDLDSAESGIWEFSPGSKSYSQFYLGGKPSHKVVSLAFSPNSQWLAVGGHSELGIWNVETGRQIGHSPMMRQIRSLAFAPDGSTLLATGYEGYRRLSLQTKFSDGLNERVSIQDGDLLFEATVNRSVLTRDQKQMAATVGSRVFLLDPSTGEQYRVLEGRPFISEVVYSPDERWLVADTWHGRGIRIWDLSNPDQPPVDLLTSEQSTFVRFSPDGKWLVAAAPKFYQFWKAETWEPVRRLERPGVSGSNPGFFVFHPSGDFFAASLDSKLVHLIETESLEIFAELRPTNPGSFADIEFSPDGTKLAMVTVNRNVFVWDLPKLRKDLATLGLDWD